MSGTPSGRPSGPKSAGVWNNRGIRPVHGQREGLTTPFTVRAPASSANLGPGFDALGLALDLWNEIDVDPTVDQDRIEIRGRDADLLRGEGSAPHENLVLRAMRQLAEAHGWDLPPVGLTFRNGVPVSRGLGSSAAALAAGLLAADALLGLGLSRADIYGHAWRMEGHGDNVGAAIYGGAILSVPGVPEAVQLIPPGSALSGLTAVVYIPGVTGATWAARAALPATVPLPDAAFNLATTAGIVAGFLSGDRAVLGASMDDRLHQPYRARLFPHLDPVTRAARSAGAFGAALSGAGPTILALTDTEMATFVRDAMADAGQRAGVPGESVTLAVTLEGAGIVHQDKTEVTPSRRG
ncbi:MAG TPA: homoserine kinase [Thermomicrobiales bacterium]|jgi:homoserine kinase|nr:homoserine kinase [Thermomicrobiales bacterium]